MTVEDSWREQVARVSLLLSQFPQEEHARLAELCERLREQKLALQALADRADAAASCAACGGACCVTGKYHVTPVDLLVYLVNGELLFAPHFESGLCPYLGEGGCLMRPAYRPFNCITFNCELIEDLLSAEEVSRFYRLERELKGSYQAIRALFPGGGMDGALL